MALLIHTIFFLIFYLLHNSYNPIQKPQVQEKRIKIALKKLQPKTIQKTLLKKKTLTKTIVKPKKKQTRIKKKKIISKKKYQTKDLLHKIKQLTIKKAKPIYKVVKKDSLFNILSQDYSTTKITKKSDPKNAINQNIKELYGDKFNTLTKGQQEYILNNQEIMRRITQEVLNRVARVNLNGRVQVNSSNIVEFYLHKNGDISDFHFLQKSKLFILDDTTKETIMYAYSKYPLPKEKTLIRYNVFYNLAR